jgi:hypothetical protein
LILIDDPFEGGAVAETVVESFFRDAGECEEFVVDECGFVLTQFHFLDAIIESFAFLLFFLEWIFRLPFVIDVDFGEALAGFGEGAENIDVIPKRAGDAMRKLLGCAGQNSRFLTGPLARFGMTSAGLGDGTYEWNAREFAAEVGGVAGAIFGMMQDGVDVVEDVPFGLRRG